MVMAEIIKIIAQDGNGASWIDLLIPIVFMFIFIIGNIVKMKNKKSLKDYEEDDKGKNLTDLEEKRYKPLEDDTSRYDRTGRDAKALPYAKYHKSSEKANQQSLESQREEKRRHRQLIEEKRRQLEIQKQKEQEQRQLQAQLLMQRRQEARQQQRTQAEKQNAYQQRIIRTADKMREQIEERVESYSGKHKSKRPVKKSRSKLQKIKPAPKPLTKAPVLGEKRKAAHKSLDKPLSMERSDLGSVIGKIKEPKNIRKAIVYSEILGLPKALKADTGNLWDF